MWPEYDHIPSYQESVVLIPEEITDKRSSLLDLPRLSTLFYNDDWIIPSSSPPEEEEEKPSEFENVPKEVNEKEDESGVTQPSPPEEAVDRQATEDESMATENQAFDVTEGDHGATASGGIEIVDISDEDVT